MIQWLVIHWHWLYLAGVFLSIMGLLYAAYGSLRERYKIFQRLAQSFAFGVLGGIIGSLGAEIILFVIFTMVWVISGKSIFSGLYFSSFLRSASSNFISGLVLGISGGFLLGFLNFRLKKVGLSSESLYRWVNLTLFLIYLLLLIAYNLVNFLQNGMNIDIILNASFILGFVTGIVFRPLKISWISVSFWIVLSTILILLALSYIVFFKRVLHDEGLLVIILSFFENNIIAPNTILLEFFILGFLPASLLNQSVQAENDLKQASWKKFAIWLVIGWALAFILPLFAEFMSASYLDNQAQQGIAACVSAIGLLLIYAGGEGNKLIRQKNLKMYFDQLKNRNRLRFNKERFTLGFIITWLYCFAGISTISFVLSVIWDEKKETFVFVGGGFWHYVIAPFAVSLYVGSIISLLVASAYGFGHIIVLGVNNLNEHAYVKIGVLLGILGIIALALPSLVN